MKKKRGALRLRAIEAKHRLAKGFWSGQGGAELVKALTRESDDELYPRVRSLLDDGVTPSRLLSLIIDREHFDNLDESRRERYVFDLSHRIHECVKRYNDEGEKNHQKSVRILTKNHCPF